MLMGRALSSRKNNKKFMLLSAIGIVMVVDAHSWGALDLFTSFIPYNSFFMPMFVFISGYFNKVDSDTSLWEYGKRKCKSLLLPYFCISYAAYFIDWILQFYKLGTAPPLSLTSVLRSVLAAGASGEITEIASPLWFIPTLFAVQIVYACLKRVLYKRWNSRILLIAFSLVNIMVVRYAQVMGTTPYTLLVLKVLFFLPFMELGAYYRDVWEKKLANANPLALLLLLLMINMARIMVLPNPSDIAFNNLSRLAGFTSPYPTTPLISYLVGILFWLEVVELVGPSLYENRIVNYISENTLFIMGFHILFFNLLNCVLLAIHRCHPLPEFSVSAFQETAWYRWEHFRQFRLAYFSVGLLGSLALKQAYDRIIKKRFTNC